MKSCVIEIEGREPARFECPDELTVLDAAAKAGWELPYSCRRGNCETCRATVLSGELTPPADADGTALLCQVRALSDIRIAPDRAERVERTATKRVRARFYRMRMAAPDVAIVDLRFPAGVRAAFKAGQYLQVGLQNEPQPRSFSMANVPRVSDAVQLHVRVLPGSAFGERILPTLKPGDEVALELPFGDFYLRDDPAPVVMVAGGTGFAPIQSMLDEALPKQRERAFTLYWGARKADGLYAMEQVRKWQQKYANFRFIGVVSDDEVPPDMRAGLVHEAVLHDHASLAGHQVYVCGSPPLVQAARQAFVAQRGLNAGDFYSDAFAATAAASP
jgi:NAD(P)H-flavin reductase/ferredoxin